MRAPSGDHTGREADPRAVNACDLIPSSVSDQIEPRCTHATRSPFGDTAGESPSPNLRGAPPSSATIQTSSVTPAGLSVGLADPPRTYTIADASGVQRSPAISCP